MTQPARRFDIWRRLYSRFLIEPLPAALGEAPGVGTLIVPITDADALLKDHGIVSANTASFDADAQVTGLVVPAGKRWEVHAFNAQQVSGNRTITQMRINDVSVGVGYVTNDFTAAIDNYTLLGTPLPMEEGDSVDIVAVGGSTASVYNVQVWRSEEDAF